MTVPSADDFEIWKDSPVTQWVMAGVQIYADRQKRAWLESSWFSGVADQVRLTEYSIRADAYEGLAGLTYEQAFGLHEDEKP